MTLQAQSLSLSLRGRPVLRDVSAALPKGKVSVIIGPNGAGKSTLLSCLSGLRVPDKGEALLDGTPVYDMPARERARRIGLLPQQADIHWDVNVRALVSLGRLPYHDRRDRGAEDKAAIDAAMAQTDCLHLADRTALRLSGGEQARVLLARVFAGQPEWILADEPLANLDPAHQLDALNALASAARVGAGVILVLHDLTQAARIADNIVILKAGAVHAAGNAKDVLTLDILQSAFDVGVHIGKDSDGAPIIVPTHRVS
jgi:iron complex transport system ATP-binding protein